MPYIKLGDLDATRIFSPRARINTTLGPALYIAAADSTPDHKAFAQYVCAGVNDHLRLIEAMDELGSTGGDIILLAGTYRWGERIDSTTPIVDLSNRSNINIRGQGQTVTIIKPPSTRSSNTLWFKDKTAGAVGITFSDLTFDGEQPTYGVGNRADKIIELFDANSKDVTFERITVKNWDSFGGSSKMNFTNGDRLRVAESYFYNNHHTPLRAGWTSTRIESCIFEENGRGEGEEALTVGVNTGLATVMMCFFLGHGALELIGGSGRILGNHFEKTDTNNNHTAFFTGNVVTSLVFDGNTIEGPGYTVGIGTGAQNTVLSNNVITTVQSDGISCLGPSTGSGPVIIGNTIIAAGQGTTGTYASIALGALAAELTIANNVLDAGPNTNKVKYHIEMPASSGTSGGNRIGFNTFLGAPTAANILDAADGTVYHDSYVIYQATQTSDTDLAASETTIMTTNTFAATSTRPRKLRVRVTGLSGNDTAGGRNKFHLKTNAGTYLDEVYVHHANSGDNLRVWLEWQGTITGDTSFVFNGFDIVGAGRSEAGTSWPTVFVVEEWGDHPNIDQT